MAFFHGVHFVRGRTGVHGAVAQQVQRAAAHQGQQPGHGAATLQVETRRAAPGLEIDIGQQVVAVAATQQASRDRSCIGQRLVVEDLEGRRVAARRRRQQQRQALVAFAAPQGLGQVGAVLGSAEGARRCRAHRGVAGQAATARH
ncbi:MAG: hypothetical protein IPO41_12930 [Acidobacteria bacterium]|nr:hypothetical protein [Acidobacteriota bacterium]